MTKSFFMRYIITVLMIFGFFPNESSDKRVVVGTFVPLPCEPLGFHVAFVENVVYAKPKPVGMVGDSGS